MFDLGNGDAPVECKPLPKVKGDCVYTYRKTSRDQPDLAFPAKLLVTWTFRATTSDNNPPPTPDKVITTEIGIKVGRVSAVAIGS